MTPSGSSASCHSPTGSSAMEWEDSSSMDWDEPSSMEWETRCSRGRAAQACADLAAGSEALQRLCQIPPALQDKVISYLPLADILVWQRVGRNFYHRIAMAGMRERALCRSLGHRFAWEAFTRENCDELLLPWLKGLAAKPFDLTRPCAALSPDVFFCAVSRSLRNSHNLVLKQERRFSVWQPQSRSQVMKAAFSSDGRYITCTVQPFLGRMETVDCEYIFERDLRGWHPGSAFVGEQGADRICFTADSRRVAVAEPTGEVVIWDRCPQERGLWKQQARLRHHLRVTVWVKTLVFSPGGSQLLVQGKDDSLRIWHAQPWRLCGSFPPLMYLIQADKAVFSPDERWLLLVSVLSKEFVLFSRNHEGIWEKHTLIDAGPEEKAVTALFRGEGNQLQLFVLLARGALLVLQFSGNEGSWYRRETLQHPYGIEDMVFGPDGVHLVTHCSASGAILWSQNGQGEWQPQLTMNRLAEGMVNRMTFHFDSFGRWIMAGEASAPFCRKTMNLWVQDSAGAWQSRSTEVGSPDAAESQALAVAADGQHLVTVNKSALYLMEITGGDWIPKAASQSPGVTYTQVATDPFCCYLAAVSSTRKDGGNERLEILRVQQDDCTVDPRSIRN